MTALLAYLRITPCLQNSLTLLIVSFIVPADANTEFQIRSNSPIQIRSQSQLRKEHNITPRQRSIILSESKKKGYSLQS